MPSKACLGCGKLRPIYAETGRCHECYAAAPTDPAIPIPVCCSVVVCTDWSVRKGMCDRHYRLTVKYGDPNRRRRVGRHPEYKNWEWLRRHGKLCQQWLEFEIFIAAIGNRPSSRHWLERQDQSAPYSPTNWYWRAPKLGDGHSMTTKEGRRAYQQAVRAGVDGYWVGGNLKAYYGLTKEQYAAMLASQGGVCAICQNPEKDKRARGDRTKVKLLSVDHDHTTGTIRGLLCGSCNKALGLLGDSPERLRAAATYLEHHA